MRKSLLRLATVAAVLGATICLSVGSAAAASPLPQPIGPNQYFSGSINGSVPNTTTIVPAVVKVICPGPTAPGQRGNPVANQPVEVLLVSPPALLPGFTGSRATSIVVLFPDNQPTLTFTAYGVAKPIPTALLLPCSGTGVVGFIPRPSGFLARTQWLPVRYVNIAV